jgi:hypothetical protein
VQREQTSRVSTLRETLPSQNLGLQRNILLCTLRYVDVQLDFFTMIYTYTIDMYEARLYWLGHTKLPMVPAFRTSTIHQKNMSFLKVVVFVKSDLSCRSARTCHYGRFTRSFEFFFSRCNAWALLLVKIKVTQYKHTLQTI